MKTNEIPRMRTLPEAVQMLHELDASSAITLCAMRRFVNDGQLPVTRIGSKRLINFDALLRLLNCPVDVIREQQTGTIRRIDERSA